MRYSSKNTRKTNALHCSTVLDIAIEEAIASASMWLNQQRSQLSFAYCTMSRKGGEVTVSVTHPAGIVGVDSASLTRNWASAAAVRKRPPSRELSPRWSCSDFLRT